MSDRSSQQQGQPEIPNRNYQQQSGSWTSNDGQGTAQQSLQMWSGSSQAMMPTFSAPPAPNMTAPSIPPMPGMLSANDFFQQGQQMFQASLDNSKHFMDRSLDLHAKALEQGRETAQNTSMSMNMNNMYQQPMFQQQALQQPPPVQQPQNISYVQNIYHHHAPQQTPPQQIAQPPQPLLIANHESNKRFQAIEQRRNSDIRDLNQAGAKVNDRLQDLERQLLDAQSSNRESKRVEQELKQLREQNAQMARQQLEDKKRRQEENRRREEEYRRRRDEDRAEWQRSQVRSLQSPAPAFDMDAVRKVILETQSKQLSSDDVHRAVEQAMNQRLKGVATKEDIEAAERGMQHRLSLEPKGASEERVRRAFGAELNKIVASIQSQREDQRRIEVPRAQRSRVQTDYIVEEIEDEPAQKPASQVNRQRALSPTSTHQEPTSLSRDVTRSSKSSKPEYNPQITSSAVAPVKPTTASSENSLARTSRRQTPAARLQTSSRTKALPTPATTTTNATPAPAYSPEFALTRTERPTVPTGVFSPPTRAQNMSVARTNTAQQPSSTSVPDATSGELVRSGHGSSQSRQSHSAQLPPAITRSPTADESQKQLPATKTLRQLPAPPRDHGGQQPAEQNQMVRIPRRQAQQSPQGQEPAEQNQISRRSRPEARQSPPSKSSRSAIPSRQLDASPAPHTSHSQIPVQVRPPGHQEVPPSTSNAQQSTTSASPVSKGTAMRQIEAALPVVASPEQQLVRQSKDVARKSFKK